jgi:hypothetical protein
MAYNPPFSGGHFNASISGNTSGAGTIISSGTLTLAGGNNITLSQNGNAITISGGAAGGAGSNTLGMSNLGNTSGTSGVISGSALNLALAGGNNITLSQSLTSNSATITISTPTQTVQTQSIIQNVSLGGNTSGTMTSISSGTLFLAGGNNITLSQSSNSVTLSGAAQTAQTQNIIQEVSLGGNTSGTLANISSGTMFMAGGNNITLSQSSNSVTISGGAGGGGGGIALAASNSTFTSGTVNLSNAGGALTLSNNGSTINLSVPQTSSLSATGAVSISSNGSTISIGAPTQTNQTLGLYATGNTTQNSSTTLDARSLTFNGLGNVSVGYSNGSIQISDAGGGGGGGTLSNWEPMPLNQIGLTASQLGVSSLYFYPLAVQGNVSATQAMHLVSGTFSSSSNASYTGAVTLSLGIYTAGTASSLNLVTQSSGVGTFAFTNTSNNSISSLSGMRGLTVPLSLNMTPGNYWLGILSKTSGTSYTMSNMAMASYGLAGTAAFNGQLGLATNNSQGVQEAVGYFNVTETSLPASAAMSQIIQSKPIAQPYFIFKNIGW